VIYVLQTVDVDANLIMDAAVKEKIIVGVADVHVAA
jgi:hypothetical protein